MIRIVLVLFILSMMLSCQKDDNLLPLSTTPSIRLLKISSDTIKEFQDPLELLIEYEDGDGDLGNIDTDINSLFIKDNRLDKADEYYVAPLAPIGSQISIRGTLNITLNGAFVLGNSASEKTYFELWMIDRAGRKSNVIRTKEITINKQ